VVGTFAFYYRTQRGPAELERMLVEQCVDLCSIAMEHEESQSRIHQLAYYDALTGLPNRAEFSERASFLLRQLGHGQTLNLLYVDLDDFKSVNDSLGHAAGDLLLECVARRLGTCVGEGVFAARLGGDEFAVLQASPTSSDGSLLAQQIIATLEEPFEIESQKVRVGASVGIANAEVRMPLTVLARHADMALAEAKEDGRGSWRVFVPAMAAAAQSRRTLKQDLRVAIDQHEFTLAYQPIVRLADRSMCAVEVLLRWQHPGHGELSPAVFVPIIEEMGMIGTLGDWVLREACRAAASWPRPLKVNVNLSPLQFRKPGFVVDVVSALHQAGLPAERLDLEVTESALLARDLATRTALHDLHDFGVRLSMDDFGTGYSSLQSLRAFPFDRIKLDMSFVRDLAIDADAAAIIRSVIALARDLGMRTTAEGVEHHTQHDWLLRNGCDEAQGYHFGRPMRETELRALFGDMPAMGVAGADGRTAGHAGSRVSSAG
jgi:diguanylate cyclase (GGDEF)-like protein